MYQKISSLTSSIIYSADVKHKSNTRKYNKKGVLKGWCQSRSMNKNKGYTGKNTLTVFFWSGRVSKRLLIVVEYLEGVHENSFDHAYLPAGICNVAT